MDQVNFYISPIIVHSDLHFELIHVFNLLCIFNILSVLFFFLATLYTNNSTIAYFLFFFAD